MHEPGESFDGAVNLTLKKGADVEQSDCIKVFGGQIQGFASQRHHAATGGIEAEMRNERL
jgi:hypothetical protein